jgi:CheY-like chemotaxis protein
VDDDDGFRALVADVLDHCGYLLVEASSGEAALERLFKKLGAHSRAQAVSFGYVHGLLDRAEGRGTVASRAETAFQPSPLQ